MENIFHGDCFAGGGVGAQWGGYKVYFTLTMRLHFASF